MRALALALAGALGSASACGKESRRDAIMPLRPALSQLRSDLLALVPTLRDAQQIGAGDLSRLPGDALVVDARDAAREDTIIIGVPSLRDPYNVRNDAPLEAGFAYRHRFLDCLRDVADGSTSGNEPASPEHRAGCERASKARWALVYRVAEHKPARFDMAQGELVFEPGRVAVEWHVVDLGPEGARKATVVGELVVRAETPQTLDLDVDVGAELGLVEARRQAADALSKLVEAALVRELTGKVRSITL
ncbi:MAG: hypothetical protein IT385_11940 [Deltaproteobacteria bacterium]|nr:hypothetical protein [Deltaproteobacteria bacterium]